MHTLVRASAKLIWPQLWLQLLQGFRHHVPWHVHRTAREKSITFYIGVEHDKHTVSQP